MHGFMDRHTSLATTGALVADSAAVRKTLHRPEI
jgi:hypothetical protein